MPSVAQEPTAVQQQHCKKRRLDDGTDRQLPFPHSVSNSPRGIFADRSFDHDGLAQHHRSSPLATRKIIPLPSAKRQRTTVDIDREGEGEPMQRSPPSSPPQKHQRQHQQQTKIESREELHDKDRLTTPATTTTIPTNPTPASLMSRCHICFRKPNKKSDLDSFADCQGCGQRTCYVCIRECLGWGLPNLQTRIPGNPLPSIPSLKQEASFTMLDVDAPTTEYHQPPPEPRPQEHEHGWERGGGHRQMVCSRCCVEKGQDGDVVCLGCLPFVEG